MAEYEPVENYFDQFCVATSYEKITSSFERLCDTANLRSLPGSATFYKELRQRLSFYWKAEALFANLDVKFADPTYGNQTVCQNINVWSCIPLSKPASLNYLDTNTLHLVPIGSCRWFRSLRIENIN